MSSPWLPVDFGPPVAGVASLIATGISQSDAYQITKQVSIFGTVLGGSGALLPSSFAANKYLTVSNQDSPSLLIYPARGDRIGALDIDAPFSLTGGGNSVAFISFDPPAADNPRQWWAINLRGPQGLPGSLQFGVDASPYLNGGTVTAGSTITAASVVAQSLIGNGTLGSAVPTPLRVSGGFTMAAGTVALTGVIDTPLISAVINDGTDTLAGGAAVFQTGNGGPSGGAGGDFDINTGAGVAANASGGAIVVQTGSGVGSGSGGLLAFVAGAAGATGTGASISSTAGQGGSTSGAGGTNSLLGGAAIGNGVGGAVVVEAGNGGSAGGAGGMAILSGGAAEGGNANGGNVFIAGGAGAGSGVAGTIEVTGPVQVSGLLNAGTLQQNGTAVLTGVTLTGDVTGSGAGSVVTTLPSIVAAGTVGSGSVIPVVGINAKGQVVSLGSAAAISAIGSIVGGAGVEINGGFAGTLTTSGTLAVGQQTTSVASGAYTLVATDQAKQVNVTALGAAVHPILQTSNYAAGWWADLSFTAGRGLVTASSGSINGAATLFVATAQSYRISFDGVNYAALPYSPFTTLNNGNIQFPNAGVSIGSTNTLTGDGGPGQLAVGSGHSVGDANPIFAFGNSHRVAAVSAAFGNTHTIIGTYSFGIGQFGTDDKTVAAFVHATGGGTGQNQYKRLIMAGTGSSTTPIRTSSSAGTIGPTNSGSLSAGATQAIRVTVQVKDLTAGGSVTFMGLHSDGINWGQISQPTTVGTGTVAAGFTWTQGPTLGSIGSLGTMSPLTYDTTNGGPVIAYVPGGGNTNSIRVSAILDTLQAK